MRPITTRLTAAVAAVALLGPAATADAHKLSDAQLRKAAAPVAEQIERRTKARSSAVRGCKRLFDHRGTCTVISRYAGGAPSCTTTVEVVLKGARPRAQVGSTVCG